MPGKYQYDIELKSNVAKLLTDMKEVQDRLDTVEGKEYKIKLNVDEKKISNVISNLEKMLDSLGKGTGDFKQFENLSKELSSIVSEVQNLSKAFGKVDDSGTKTLLSSIQNIDKSLSELSQHIINVNKNMSNIGGDTNSAVKQVENISNAYDNAAKSAEKLADAQNKIGNKSNISSENNFNTKEIDDYIDKYNKLEKLQLECSNNLLKFNAGKIKVVPTSDGKGFRPDPYGWKVTDEERNRAYQILEEELQLTNQLKILQDDFYSKYGQDLKELSREKQRAIDITNEQIKAEENLIKTQEKSKAKSQSQKPINSENVKDDISGIYSYWKKYSLYKSEGVLQAKADVDYKNIIKQITAKRDPASGITGNIAKFIDKSNVLQDVDIDYFKAINIELEKIGYHLDKIKIDKNANIASAKILPIDDKAITNAEEMMNILKNISSEGAKISSGTQIKDVFQGDKIEQATTFAKELDKTLKQVDIPTDSFDDVLSKLDLAESKLKGIVKITKQSVSDSEGNFHDSYTLKDKRGSTEIYGLSSNTEKGQLLRSNIVEYDAKAAEQEAKALEKANKERQKAVDNTKLEEQKRIYKELNDSLDRYATVSKRIAGGNALGSDEEEAAKLQERIEELQNSPILSKEQLELSQSKLEKIETTLEDIQKITKETTLDSLQSEIDSFKKDYDNRDNKPNRENRSVEYQQALDNYLASIEKLKVEKERLSKLDSISEEELSHYKKLKDAVQENVNVLKAMSAAQKGSDALSRGKEIDTITKYLNKFTGISKQAKRELNGLLDQLQSSDPSVNVKKIHERFLELTVAERNAGREARNLFDIFKDKKIYSFIGQAASMFSFYDLINYGREGIDTIREFDDGLTKISYTMDMTKSQLDNLGNSVLDMASDMKSSIDDAMQVAQIYANMQTSAEEIQRLSEPTLILSNLSGFDSSTIADDIQAVTQQFDILAEDSMHIVDVYDYISRNIAVDYSKGLNAMAEGLQVAGSTAKQAGLSYEQTASIIAKAVEKTRLEGSQVGNGLKTIMTRLSKVGELSEEVDNETLSQASESLKKVGIEVYNLDGSYREFDVIMGELAGKWDDLTDAEKSNISFNIAATRQTNLLSAVLSNFSDSMQLAEEATNANGSALENQQKYMESFSGHLQSLETEAKIAWLNILDSETLKDGVDLLTGLVKVVGQLVDIFGLIGTAAGIGGIVAGFKNIGRPKTFGLYKYADINMCSLGY